MLAAAAARSAAVAGRGFKGVGSRTAGTCPGARAQHSASCRAFRPVPTLPRFPGRLATALPGAALFGAWAAVAAKSWSAGPTAAAQCETRVEIPQAATKALTKKREGGLLSVVCSFVCWGIFVTGWVTTVGFPAVMAWALATMKWNVVTGLGGLYLLPILVTVPQLPDCIRYAFLSSMAGWFPSATVARYPGRRSLKVIGKGNPEAPATPTSDQKPVMVGLHPHGVYTIGFTGLTTEMPDCRILGSPLMTYAAPVFKILVDLLGVSFGSVGPGSLASRMGKGETPLAMVPGGFEEATIVCPGHERVFLKDRRGFVKYALRHGYDLVPCYTLGESDCFSNPQGAWALRWGMNAFKVPAVLPFGFPLLPLFPRRVPMHTAIGDPVPMPHIPNPSRKDVAEHHARYVAALEALVAEASVGTPSEGRKLEVW